MPRTAEIIAVGSELLTGGVTNTNARFLSELLTAAGVDVLYHTAVGDGENRLGAAVTAVLLVPVLTLAPDMTAFFNSKPEVVSYGALLLRLLSPFYFFFCINQIYSAALRGAGNSQVPMWIMLGSFVVFRQIYLYIVAYYGSNEIIPIAMSYPAGWFVCSVATLIYYRIC